MVVGGCWSPMLLSKLPCNRLSSAFCTVGSFSRGDGDTPVLVVVVAVVAVDAAGIT